MKRLIAYVLIGMIVLGMLPTAVLARGPGGGGEETTAANNLSFPVIWSTNTKLLLNGAEAQASLTVPYTDVNPCGDGYLPYAQKTDGNVWQAANEVIATGVVVDGIDRGDSLESVYMKVGRPVRIEATLYKDLAEAMLEYPMVMLANPSSPDEVQGVCAQNLVGTDALGGYDNGNNINDYDSYKATIYTPNFGLVIQQITPGTAYTWNSVEKTWDDADSPITPIFAGELNVGGKVIYGLAEGGWKPSVPGTYRITFYLTGSDTSFVSDTTSIVNPGGIAGVTAIDYTNNLTYVDITVVSGGRGGH